MPFGDWNYTYQVGDYMSDLTVASMFCDAVNERLEVIGLAPIPTPTAAGTYLTGFYRTLMQTVYGTAVRRYFVRNKDSGGSEIDYDGEVTLLGWYNDAPINWPPPNGFTRKWPREITTLSASGTAGQLARLSARPFGTTPAAQIQYSGKTFLHDGTTWNLNSNPYADPDLLTGYGLPLFGDYVGTWIFNELRDAINLLVWTYGSPFYSIDGASNFLATANVQWVDNYIRSGGAAGDPDGMPHDTAGLQALAESRWDAATRAATTLGTRPQAANSWGIGNNDTWGLGGVDALLKTFSMPTTKNRHVEFYAVGSHRTENGMDFFGDPQPLNDGTLRKFDEADTTADNLTSTVRMGNADSKPLPPWVAPAGLSSARGWLVQEEYSLIKWDFTYKE